MRKIVSNVLVVSMQLIVGGLFLCMLFSDDNENNKVVVIENDNLNKMADSVSVLFAVSNTLESEVINAEEIELPSADCEEEEVKKEETEVKEEVIENETKEEVSVPVVEEEPEPEPIITVDPSGYSNNPSKGFNVTTNNKTYSLNDDDYYVVAAVVSCEANRASKDDILGVISVILNRADRNGVSPVSIVSASGQFSCYNMYTKYTPTNVVKQTINDALNGVRNNNYYGFRSWASVGYSDNYIVEGGNRYGY